MNNKNIKTIIAAVAIIFSSGTFEKASAQVSNTLSLSGDVATLLALAIAPSGADSLDLEGGAVNDATIATITEFCNDADGYTVSVTSANGQALGTNVGILQGGDHSENAEYTLKYDNSPVSLLGGTATVTNSNDKTVAAGVSRSLKITYDESSSNLAADTYTDTLTFTITAK